MHETYVTVAGNVATEVTCGISANGHPVARFRLASTVRRFHPERQAWVDGVTSFYTVWAWRTLATNVASSVSRGQPVLVQGQLRIKQGEREGKRFLSADVIASTVGHDLSRGTAAFVRGSAARPVASAPAPSAEQAAAEPEFTMIGQSAVESRGMAAGAEQRPP